MLGVSKSGSEPLFRILNEPEVVAKGLWRIAK